ncbi:ParB/RepB/Spo0J family partition protein [candidate division WOR-3 bacterium]|nr:ParB/RepB/Spo0J family partition protein [candidate division WOR-3 bacterium]
MKKRKALGRGLAALIPERENIVALNVADILPNPYEIRKDTGNISELISSIKEKGIIEPIVVRHTTQGYELVCGGRRLVACKELDIKEIPVVVKDINDRELFEISLVENLQRKNLNPIEEAEAYEVLINEFGLSHQEIAHQVGKNRTTITNTLRLLNLPPEVKLWLKQDKLTAGHARALLQVKSKEAIIKLAERILKQKISVRVVEKAVKSKAPFLLKLEKELSSLFNTKIRIIKGKKKGKIEIEFHGDADFSRIIKKLGITL